MSAYPSAAPFTLLAAAVVLVALQASTALATPPSSVAPAWTRYCVRPVVVTAQGLSEAPLRVTIPAESRVVRARYRLVPATVDTPSRVVLVSYSRP